MESLFDLLSNRIPDEPAEIRAIKGYVRQHFQLEVNVSARDKDIVITVPNGSLAGTLRARTSAIYKLIGSSEKRLVFRIGQIEK